jgi:hypothetical protein
MAMLNSQRVYGTVPAFLTIGYTFHDFNGKVNTVETC